MVYHYDGWVQGCSISNALAMQVQQHCTKQSGSHQVMPQNCMLNDDITCGENMVGPLVIAIPHNHNGWDIGNVEQRTRCYLNQLLWARTHNRYFIISYIILSCGMLPESITVTRNTYNMIYLILSYLILWDAAWINNCDQEHIKENISYLILPHMWDATWIGNCDRNSYVPGVTCYDIGGLVEGQCMVFC